MPNFLMAFLRLGMYREAEKQFKSALKQQEMVDTFLYLAKVSVPHPSGISSELCTFCQHLGRVASFFRNILASWCLQT